MVIPEPAVNVADNLVRSDFPTGYPFQIGNGGLGHLQALQFLLSNGVGHGTHVAPDFFLARRGGHCPSHDWVLLTTIARNMAQLIWLKESLEYLGGARDTAPAGWPSMGPLAWGVWWAVLIALILVFSGQTSKFIYIDF